MLRRRDINDKFKSTEYRIDYIYDTMSGLLAVSHAMYLKV